MNFNAKEAEKIIRTVCGFDKTGDQRRRVKYYLKPMDIDFLRKLFNIDMTIDDLGGLYMLYCYHINQEQAEALQPYVIDGVIDLSKYLFMLESERAYPGQTITFREESRK